MRFVLLVAIVLLSVVPVSAREIAGVSMAEQIEGADGTPLTLNGAGVRSKLFFKIYVAGLYLENPATEAPAILAADGQRRMVMHFLYDEVSRDKLVDAWNEGFTGNVEQEQLAGLALEIERFNAMFDTVTEGQEIILDYIPGAGTSVRVAGVDKGIIAGKDFADALFAIWLGQKPVTADLKQALLNPSK